ncbi:MAG TPA: LysR family transcriptional regulator [Solirubrobacteraceae bacterium]|nr:LysR family transcriptional regulator [Solirubrobacteraceae bacterium]
MELRHLRYFVAIAEERSFTGAAERLWVAQPGLSTQMRRLESELGVRLFERHARGVELTDAGTLFLERARVALAATESAAATGRELQSGVIGSIRLGIATGASSTRAAELLQRYGHERPRVELTVLEAYGGTLWRDLREGRLDALIALRGHASPDLRTLDFGSGEWVALVGVGHRLAGIGPLPAEDLAGEQIAITGHRDGAVFDRAVADLLEELGAKAELVDAPPGPALYASIARNQAVMVTPAPIALPTGLVARRLDPRRTVPFELLWRDETPSPALAELTRLAATIQLPATTRALAAVA